MRSPFTTRPLAALAVAALAAFSACSDDGGSAVEADASPDTDTDNADVEADAPIQALSCVPAVGRCDALGVDAPGRLSEHAAAYVPERREMIVFGGSSAVPQACDIPVPIFEDTTWVYDEPCNAWTLVDATPNPGPRVRHMMTYGGGRVWLFGGRYRAASNGPYTLYNDVWAFDPEVLGWSAVSISGPAPEARVSGALVYDERRGHLWLFGGNTSTAGTRYDPLRDVWELDPEAGTWTQHSISGSQPAERLFHAGVYDVRRDALVIFGGGDETAFDFENVTYMRDTWSLDLEMLLWTRLSSGEQDGPRGRFWAGLVFDPIADRYIVFGGHDEASGGDDLGNRNDTWELDPDSQTWAAATAEDLLNNPTADVCNFPVDFTSVEADLPERRNAHTMVWSPCGHALVFGGKTDCGVTDDVWSYAAGSWIEVQEATVGEVCLRWRGSPDNCTNLCI